MCDDAPYKIASRPEFARLKYGSPKLTPPLEIIAKVWKYWWLTSWSWLFIGPCIFAIKFDDGVSVESKVTKHAVHCHRIEDIAANEPFGQSLIDKIKWKVFNFLSSKPNIFFERRQLNYYSLTIFIIYAVKNEREMFTLNPNSPGFSGSKS